MYGKLSPNIVFANVFVLVLKWGNLHRNHAAIGKRNNELM